MKLPRFMLAQNHLAKNVDKFILHARKPAFIARVTVSSENSTNCQIGNTESFLELMEVYQEDPKNEVLSILKQMARWYYYSHVKSDLD